MEYKYTNDKKSIAKQDVHIIGVFSDKKLNHVESVISKESLIDIKRIINRGAIVGLADGEMFVDDKKIYTAEKLKVGLFKDPSNF